MRTVNSAFWLALQQEAVDLTELITLDLTDKAYRWTSSNNQVVSSGYIYDPFPGMSGKGAEEGTDLGVGVIQFSLANTGELQNYLVANELDFSPVTVRRVFQNSPDLGTIWVFNGKLGDLLYNRNTISGQARNLFNGVAAKYPLFTYQDTCVWRFGSQACGVDTSSISFTGSLSASSSTPLVLVAASGSIVSSYSSNQLSRGRLTITSGVNSGQVRTIRANTGDMFALSHALPYQVDSGGSTFSIYPGCRKYLVSDCLSKYNNTKGFLGFPWIPKQQYAF